MAGTAEIFIADASDRAAGVQTVCEQYDLTNFFGANVALKANYNSADPPPACTDIDTLDALITAILAENPKKLNLAERSGMGNTRNVLEERGVFALAKEKGFSVVVLDELDRPGWTEIQAAGLHWSRGFFLAHLHRLPETFGPALTAVQRALVDLAQRHGEAILPTYTHLQRGQPVLFGHHLLAYVEMLHLDLDRLVIACRFHPWPLGSGAATGVPYPIDRRRTAKALGGPGSEPYENSLDAVSSRGQVTQWVSAAAQCAVTLSRLGEDIVLWTTREFGFARLGDAVSTGSSIMPQKRNPDVFELVRGRTATAQACLAEVLGITAKLTSGYQRDLQLLKAPLFRGIDCAQQSADIMAVALVGVRFVAENTRSMAVISATG